MTEPAPDVDELLVGRRAELDLLAAALEDAARRGGRCALVEGEPGVGKSTLVQAFGDDVLRRGGVFAYGRCQEGATVPYPALADALGQLVAAMEAASAGQRDRWRRDLAGATSASQLVPLVPALATLLGPVPPGAPGDDIGARGEGRHRLHRAVVRLLAVTASYRPVVLAVDDLHRADGDTVLLLRAVLAAGVRDTLLVAAYRTGELDPARLAPDNPVAVPVGPLTPAELETLLAAAGRATDLAAVAAEFLRRTGGNPLQVRQLVWRARWEGALVRPAGEGPATWDLAALAAFEAGSDAAALVGGALERLRPAAAATLAALACIGREFDLDEAAGAAGLPLAEVARAVWEALELRLLDAVDVAGRRVEPVIDHGVRYRFSHDRVAEAARSRLDEDSQRQVHLRLGRQLSRQARLSLFEAARHLGIGGVAADPTERERFARLELQAAAAARARSSFPLALECCRAGLALLGPLRWTTHPELTRQLHLGAAEAANLVGDVALLDTLLDEGLARLRDRAGRAHLDYLRLRGQVARHHLQDAMDTGLRVLAELGEPLPRSTAAAWASLTMLRTRLAVRRWSDDRLLGLPRCDDPVVTRAQLVLEQLRNISYTVRQELFPFIVCKQLTLTLAHGLVPTSPVAAAGYGALLCITGDTGGGQRFGEVGLRLAARAEFRDARPQTLFLHLNFIRHWRLPIREALPQLQAAYREALDRGDLEDAGYVAAVLLHQSFYVGRPLVELDELARAIVPQIRSQPAPADLCRATQQLFLNLMGRSEDPFLLAGESGFDERVALPAARAEHDLVALSSISVIKLGLRFWCGQSADGGAGVAKADEAERHLAGMVGTPNVPLFHLTGAFVRMRSAPRDAATARAVRRSLAAYARWARAAPANYAAPHALIGGAWALVRGDLTRAERRLDAAIAAAERHRLPLMAALAQEEMGEVYACTGRSTLARTMVAAAHERWLACGMTVRSSRLEGRYPWLLPGGFAPAGPAGVDLVARHRLAQALSAAPSRARLVEVLLGAVDDVTGADRVVLLGGDPDRPAVRAVRERGAVTVTQGPVEPGYDRQLVAAAARSRRPATAQEGDGPAALAVPVLLRDRVVAVIVAERRGPGPGFGAAAEEAVVAACAQAAAALWGFELEHRLAEADERRRSLLDAQSRFIPGELLRILDIDDITRVRRGLRVERDMTVLISDIRGYTTLLEGMDVAEASDMVMGFLLAVELPIVVSNGLLQDVRGDEVLAVFDGPPDDAVRAGLAMLRSLGDHNRERAARGAPELRVGIGVNTGPVAMGLVGGVNRMALSVIGDAVNLASRIESATKRYQSNLLVSEATVERLAHPGEFAIRRMERVLVVNRRRPVTIYEVYDDDPPVLRDAKRAAQPAFDAAFAAYDAGDTVAARAAFRRCAGLLPGDEVAPLHLAHLDGQERGDLGPGQYVPLSPK